jgi:hypothetical protein
MEEQVQLDDITDQKKSETKEDEDENQEAGPSVGKKKTREKLAAPRTTGKHKELTLSFPQIPEGVKVVGDMLGSINKLKYVDHDMIDIGKFVDHDMTDKCTWILKERFHQGIPFWS